MLKFTWFPQDKQYDTQQTPNIPYPTLKQNTSIPNPSKKGKLLQKVVKSEDILLPLPEKCPVPLRFGAKDHKMDL